MLFHGRYGYLPLPAGPGQHSPSQKIKKHRKFISKRLLKTFVTLTLLGLITFYLTDAKLPPLYQGYRNRENNLPHYELSAPYPNGAHAKYVFFANHQRGVGWGNVMQELLLHALLAYSAKRSFVFYDYEWNTKFKFSIYDGHLIPSTIPLSAIFSGLLVGGFIYPPDVPWAVSEKHFLEVCSNRTLVRSEELREHLQGATALQILHAWVRKLETMEDRCIEVPRGSWSIFDFMLFGSKHVLDIWPTLLESPILAQLDWSSLIHSAFNSNRDIFGSLSVQFSSRNTSDAAIPLIPPPRIPDLLVVHIRRGDFSRHCNTLARWSACFNGFNQFEGLPDQFEIPQGGGWGENTPENFAIYREHCLPSIPHIVSKISKVRQRYPELNRLYIMTNGRKEWVAELTRTLQQDSGKWSAIRSTRDLVLTWEQNFVSHALDMYVAQRARSFIGNGWSSLTSNIVILRMAGKHEPNTTFFW